MSGKFLMIYIWNFHVLCHLLLICICKLHWNFSRSECVYVQFSSSTLKKRRQRMTCAVRNVLFKIRTRLSNERWSTTKWQYKGHDFQYTWDYYSSTQWRFHAEAWGCSLDSWQPPTPAGVGYIVYSYKYSYIVYALSWILTHHDEEDVLWHLMPGH